MTPENLSLAGLRTFAHDEATAQAEPLYNERHTNGIESHRLRFLPDGNHVYEVGAGTTGFRTLPPHGGSDAEPRSARILEAHADGAEVDWAEALAGYRAQVDFPGAAVWQELSIAFPEAKVVHTERPEEDWWASYSGTIGKFFAVRESLPLPPPIAAVFETMDALLVQRLMGGFDKGGAIAAYRRNNDKVRATIPPERLLVFTPADGWGPLCSFLGVPRPTSAFPRTHARDEFWAHFGGEPVAA